MTRNYPPLRAVLFDLDGTLLDTSQDMAHALNVLLEQEGRAPLPYGQIRPQVSHGARGLLGLGFGLTPEDAAFNALRDRYLAIYEAAVDTHTDLFEGCADVLAHCEQHALPWGVVTNKPAYLTRAVMQSLGLWSRAGAVISGDDLPERKPHPAPMFAAAERINIAPAACLYVGDAERDIAAGRNAGMRTACAAWGFIGHDEDTARWQADHHLQSPHELIPLIEQWRHDA